MADLDRLGENRAAKRTPEDLKRLKQRLVARANARLKAEADGRSDAAPATPAPARATGEPIAIVGMACRFAGAPDVEAYWRMIRDGREGVTEVPPDRWAVDDFYDPAGVPGKAITRRGAFVDGVDRFEPTFFGVTPREAARMDPQQRMLLEVAWEALENGGWPADRLAGSATGVYVGVGGTDYAKAPIHTRDYYERIDAHVGVGNALSIASNRVSYALDLRGPSLSVDTACSSSSLAVHLAIDSLRRGECAAALAGGVNAILTPETTIAFSQAHMLSPEGRCRSYDAAASGYVRGEGCAMLLLKRLEDAHRDGDDVLAVVLGSAVNQDGRTPGISAPSVVQQQACLLAAMADAGVAPDDVDYIEGHGTGTPLGDPIELQALAHVFRRQSDEAPPLWLASVKANIGHTETVSGVAGLIKTVLMLRNELAPEQLHLERLNPHGGIDGTRVTPLTAQQAWPQQPDVRRRVAGVSSFGFGGTNTHLVVAEAPSLPPAASANERGVEVIKLAAKTADRLAEQASQLAQWLRADDADATLSDVAMTANTGRCDFPHRVAVVATDRDELLARLDGVSASDETVATTEPKSAWLFTGQGAQRVGMGAGLYRNEPTFRAVIERCEEATRDLLPTSLVDVLYAENADPNLVDTTQFTQPALYAVECALAELWRSWGWRPDVVLGHSVGEYAAAATAGVFSIEEGARLVCVRGKLMDAAPGDGAMAAVFADEATAAAVLAGREEALAIAAVNGPENTVLSGDASTLEAALTDLARQGVVAKKLQVSHAFHSPLMAAMLDEFEAEASLVEHRPPAIPIASNVTGKLLSREDFPNDWPAYWRAGVRETVRFADGVAAAASLGVAHWLEVGPSPVLVGMAAKCAASFTTSPTWIPSLRPGADDNRTIAEALAKHWSGGGTVDWRAVHRGRGARRVPLPNYPFRRQRYWYDNLEARETPSGAPIGAPPSPELGREQDLATGQRVYETVFASDAPVWANDHQVQGSVVAPAALYLGQALAVGDDDGPIVVEDVTVGQALAPAAGHRRRLQTLVTPDPADSTRASVAISSAATDEETPNWTSHAEATLVRDATQETDEFRPEGLRDEVVDRQSRDDFYRAIAERGLEYGPSFRVLEAVERSRFDATALVEPNESVAAETPRHRLHPALGDALMQTIACTLPLEADGSYSPHTYVPVAIRRAVWRRAVAAGEPLRAYAVRRSPSPDEDVASPESVEADAFLVDADGRAIVLLEGVRVQRLAAPGANVADDDDATAWIHRLNWRETRVDDGENANELAGTTLVVSDRGNVGDALAKRIEAIGGRCVIARDDEHLAEVIEAWRADGGGPIVYLAGLDAMIESSTTAEGWNDAERAGVGGALRLCQQLVHAGVTASQGVWIVTRGAHHLDADDGEGSADPLQAEVVGLARSLAVEHPELGLRLVDIDARPAEPEVIAESLLRVICSAGDENQIALRRGHQYVARLDKDRELAASIRNASAEGTPTPASTAWRLGLTRAGSFDALRYEASETPPPGPGQVALEVHATGLNFSDVLKALGLYPGVRDAVVPLGIEASGVVTAVGEGVDHLAPGDEALGVAPYALGSHAVTAGYALAKKPAGVTHVDAATVPITFLTAHYALAWLARLTAGERVLIHAAAGGVGLAALQVAKHVGAEVYATAGSDAKRDLLRSLGVRHVMNSRTLDFADEVRKAAGGEGVDVVLNSLPGEAIAASLRCLRAYGRFCEIGKIDIYQNRKLGLAPFQDNLSYHAIDLDRLLRERPEQVRSLLAEVMARFAEGVYRPLPHTTFPVARTDAAFRYMSQRKNIGKVVVAVRGPQAADQNEDRPLRRGAGYLVTGGLGALGRRVARWLIDQGAGGVALLSRKPGESGEAFAASLREGGAHAVCLAGDVVDAASLSEALGGLPSGFPKIAGVFHAAGVLDDGLAIDLTTDRLSGVTRPKALGAWRLHNATLDPNSPLAGVERFVMFSSVAATIGSPGQANYAAANAALDALAQRRRALGLPATSVAWGPWAAGDSDEQRAVGAGMASGDAGTAVQAHGMRLTPPGESLGLMGELLRHDAGVVAAVDADWDAVAGLLSSRPQPLLESLVESTADARGDSDLRRSLLTAPPSERRDRLVRLVRDELARVTSVSAEELSVEEPLASLGIDSLMALELKNNLETRLAITVPMGTLLSGPSVVTLAEAAAQQLTGGSEASRVAAAWAPLVTLQAGAADRQALFCMPVLGGDAASYRDLADAAPDDLPVVAIRPRGLEAGETPHTRLDETARDYADAIRRHQPDGPYHLVGWSTGGLVALAVAERLRATSAEVSLVTLLDTPPPGAYRDVDTNDDARFLTSIFEFAAKFSGDTSGVLPTDSLAAASAEERFSVATVEAKRAGMVPRDVDESHLRRMVKVGEALVNAARDYRPELPDAPILFVAPKIGGALDEIAADAASNLDAWGDRLGPQVEHSVAPGDHFSMMRGEGALAVSVAIANAIEESSSGSHEAAPTSANVPT